MRKRLFMFVTPDGSTYSSPNVLAPDVDNFQVLGFGEGKDEEEGFRDFPQNNMWVLDTCFNEVIRVEVKHRIHDGQLFYLDDSRAP